MVQHLLEVMMFVRGLLVFLALSLPVSAHASGYVVQPGDSLGLIARRYHVSVMALARANGISNVNLVQVGRVLTIPAVTRTFSIRVRWGDTLIGLASRYGVSVGTIRSLNPSLGTYLLAGQWLRVCSPCGSGSVPASPPSGTYAQAASPSGTTYTVHAGDTLSAIAMRFGVTPGHVAAVNGITNLNHIVIGSQLTIPSGGLGTASPATYDPWQARSLIASYAAAYGLESAFPLALAYQESGFNQSVTSATGAIGVMQVEPYTATVISRQLGRSVNLYVLDDNIRAGVYWLANLVAYYGGDERLAAAAYYQGTRSIARVGFFRDTVQYVNNVMALKASFGG